jgi:fructose-bisphosphate aldolase/2-amino-3,7-dideoxy-D-threo-hept-6-ulosonate synthase
MAPTMPGKLLRAPYLFEHDQPLVIAPVDDLLIFGPVGGLERPRTKLAEIASSGVDAVLTFCGSLSRNADQLKCVSRIVNLSASVTGLNHTRKTAAHSVEQAIRCGADGVAYHINLNSAHVSEMITGAAALVSEADRFGLPTLGIVYPRGEGKSGDDNFEGLKQEDPHRFAGMVAHCVSLGVDLGFDAIKTVYTDDPQTFSKAVEASDGIPILIAGGPLVSRKAALERAKSAISAGAAGVSYGRNLFGRSGDLRSFVQDLKGQGRP